MASVVFCPLPPPLNLCCGSWIQETIRSPLINWIYRYKYIIDYQMLVENIGDSVLTWVSCTKFGNLVAFSWRWFSVTSIFHSVSWFVYVPEWRLCTGMTKKTGRSHVTSSKFVLSLCDVIISSSRIWRFTKRYSSYCHRRDLPVA